MAPVDLKKNKDALLNAHKDVSDPKSATNWYEVLFYEGKDERFGFLEMLIVQIVLSRWASGVFLFLYK